MPLYVAGFSAGGAGAMSVAYELGEQLTGAVSIAPIAIPWNVFSNPQFITPAPATPINHWAAVFALDTISPPFYTTYYGGTITPLLQYIFQDGNTYNDTNPFNRLQHGSPLKTPLLILTGAGDELGAKEVGQQFTFSGGGRINTIPVVYGPADYTAGRIINFPAVVSMMESNDNITTVFLLSAGHTPVTPWGLDMRNLMLEFFYALENQ